MYLFFVFFYQPYSQLRKVPAYFVLSIFVQKNKRNITVEHKTRKGRPLLFKNRNLNVAASEEMLVSNRVTLIGAGDVFQGCPLYFLEKYFLL